ncbi:uncharacterized [Tachysurus ichikawai]
MESPSHGRKSGLPAQLRASACASSSLSLFAPPDAAITPARAAPPPITALIPENACVPNNGDCTTTAYTIPATTEKSPNTGETSPSRFHEQLLQIHSVTMAAAVEEVEMCESSLCFCSSFSGWRRFCSRFPSQLSTEPERQE